LLARGNVEEATWLTFLSTVIGAQDDDDPWHAVRVAYSGLGDGVLSWRSACAHPAGLDAWQQRHMHQLTALRFANHRKFESWKDFARTLRSYVSGVQRIAGGSQQVLLRVCWPLGRRQLRPART
jgi:hypothetical protein